jgi:hypothetical protein
MLSETKRLDLILMPSSNVSWAQLNLLRACLQPFVVSKQGFFFL